MSSFLSRRVFALMAAVSGAAFLAGCQDTGLSQRGLAPISSEMLALMDEVGVAKDAPTLIRAYKKEAELEVWKMKPDGRYTKLKTFPMCRWSGQLGPKLREGDRQAPEGFYAIAPGQLNPNSSYYLSFNVGYPNAYDRAHGATGGTIMVHGACSSAGCFSMTDRQVAEIYAIVRTSLQGGQNAVQMQSYPFHMTAENFAKHRLDPHIAFWRELKKGSDHFEATLQEPKVGVCNRHYVFDATPAGGAHLDANGACPPMKVDPQVAAAVAEKESKDEARIAELSPETKPVRLVYQDGGQHSSFTGRIAEVSRPELIVPPTEIALEDKSGRGAKPTTKVAAAGAPKPAADAKTPAPSETVAAAEGANPRDWMSLHKDGDPTQQTTGSIDKTKSRKAKSAAQNSPSAGADAQKRSAGAQ
jgi:murein L,D-transpeptidase YafK